MRLYLLRHARAESASGPVPDAERALTPEGRRDAAAVGAWIVGRADPPRFLLCSSARRAVETAAGVREAFDAAGAAPPGLAVTDDLYLASAWKLFERVRAVEEPGLTSLLLVGHNPGIAELAVRLAERGDAAALRSLSQRFLPASLAEIELPVGCWRELEPGGGTLVSHYAV